MKMKSLKSILLLGCLVLPVSLTRAADTDAHSFSGVVSETTNTGGYTYVQVDTGGKKLWAATTQFAVKPGDTVTVNGGMPMANFHSQSLNRDFELVYFTGSITVGGAAATSPALPPGHPPLNGEAAPVLPPGHPSLTGGPSAKTDLTGIKRAFGGQTVAEIFVPQKNFTGKAVTVRGRVVKYNAMVMGKNWLHIQDGSGSAANHDNDLTITTSTDAALGDTVLVSGLVSTNKDFGAGYKYAVILEDAKVTVE
jgi:starvation-inducible outer membrane lipoprotein